VNRTFSAVNNNTAANDLATGCYKTLRLNAGAIVRLIGAGPHVFRNIQLLGGSHLRAEPDLPVGTQRTVNVNTTITTDPNTTMTDLLINVAGTQGSLVLANNTTLNNTTINSPFRNVHPRTGTQLLECSELIAESLTVEPITTECVPTGEICECPPGFVFEFPVCGPDVDCAEARRCVRVVN
jgi:hypothetical protein